jgi:hypothetical protein
MADEVRWWQPDDFWQCALYAVAAFIHTTAERIGVPVRYVCQQLASGVASP